MRGQAPSIVIDICVGVSVLGPLSGIRVLDAGINVAGPIAAAILSDLGADVIKLEPPAGDSTRRLLPRVGSASALFEMANRNKRLISIDLRADEGQSLLRALLSTVDVVIENFRPGKAAAIGLDAATCHAVNPRIIHGSIEAFHPNELGRPGYDLLVQAESGIMDLTGSPNDGPARLPGTMIDQVVGMWLAIGVMGQLHGARERAATKVAMIDVALWMLSEKVSSYLATGDIPHRNGSGTSVTTPHGAFRAADGEIVIGAASDALYAALAGILGPPIAGDERFTTQTGRLEHRVELEAAINERLAHAPVDHWRKELEAAGIPVGVIRGLPDALARHQRNSVTGLRYDDAGFGLLAPPVQMTGASWDVASTSGPVGRDNVEVLTSLGRSAEEIRRLHADGIVRAEGGEQ